MASGIQGQLLDINVIGCNRLRDKEWLSRQDPYVIIRYASTRFRTRTDTDGGRNPSFNEKFVIPLIEGLREVNVEVWNSNTLTPDDFIGSGRVLLEKVLLTGYDDTATHLTSRSGKYAGELRVILHHTKTGKANAATSGACPGHHYAPQGYPNPPRQDYPYTPPVAAPYNPYPSQGEYQRPQSGPYSPYPQQPASHSPYTQQPGSYSSQSYPPPSTSYPPPPGPYTPPPQGYPPPPGPYSGYPGAGTPYPPPPSTANYPPIYQDYSPYPPYR